jgi:hypothetical protein
MADDFLGNWRIAAKWFLGFALEYAVLSLIEGAGIGTEVATAIIAALGLVTLQYERQLRGWHPRLFGFCLLGLASLYLAVVIYGIAQSPKASAFFYHLPTIWKGAALGATATLVCVLIGDIIVTKLRQRHAPLVISADQDADIMEQRVHYIDVGIHGEPQLGEYGSVYRILP